MEKAGGVCAKRKWRKNHYRGMAVAEFCSSRDQHNIRKSGKYVCQYAGKFYL